MSDLKKIEELELKLRIAIYQAEESGEITYEEYKALTVEVGEISHFNKLLKSIISKRGAK